MWCILWSRNSHSLNRLYSRLRIRAAELFDKRGPPYVCMLCVLSPVRWYRGVSGCCLTWEQSTTQNHIWARTPRWVGSDWTNTHTHLDTRDKALVSSASTLVYQKWIKQRRTRYVKYFQIASYLTLKCYLKWNKCVTVIILILRMCDIRLWACC